MKNLAILMTCCFLIVACKQQANEAPAPPSSSNAAPPTQPAAPPEKPSDETSKTPGLKVTTLDGKEWRIDNHRGKWVVVNYWATWCAPCLKEMPDFDQFDKARADVEFIGLAFEEIEVSAMQAFLKERPVGYPISIIDVYNPPSDFETPKGLPMTYLIAPGGEVAKQFLGPITSRDLEHAIANHHPDNPQQ
jgi:thiol-disulfide isomerase/thioredoxin